ncbi:hypothetical protein DID88_004414 [Monilinia fructigena]|uniref:Deacetylase sirtuin-type domain-containing protein n=1 Tax=Monilinia fructigena TaxID=38457 RepID=A0A395IRT9_9HELO|nr:hypothetical protein DID88_004414 [Monilinia fructigena]
MISSYIGEFTKARQIASLFYKRNPQEYPRRQLPTDLSINPHRTFKMSSGNPVLINSTIGSSSNSNHGPSNDIASFKKLLSSSTRVLALCGAGLGASSGLDTFRGPVACGEIIARNRLPPWMLLGEIRAWSGEEEGFVCLTQNVDGLAQRASHPEGSLKLLHGCLYDIKCANPVCNYRERNNFNDPYHPSLAITSVDDEKLLPAANNIQAVATYLDPNKSTTTINKDELPHCPNCMTSLLRPDIVWFGEALPGDTIDEIDQWIDKAPIDLMLVIGTTAQVYPAAEYVDIARRAGARVVESNWICGDCGLKLISGGREACAHDFPRLSKNLSTLIEKEQCSSLP